MMGYFNVVVTQIQAEEKRAVSLRVQCFAHCLTLCLQDSARKNIPVRNALDLIMEICRSSLNNHESLNSVSRYYLYKELV